MSQQSAIYNHRPLQPTGAVPPPPGAAPPPGPSGPPNNAAQQPPAHPGSSRFAELLDFAKQEFDHVAQEAAGLKGQRDEFEARVGGQISELNIIRATLYDLETSHAKVRQQYEQEVTALRQEIQALHQQQHQQQHPSSHHPGPPLHQPSASTSLGLSTIPPPPSHSGHPPHGHTPYPPPPAAAGSGQDPYYSKQQPPPGYRTGPGHPDDGYPSHAPSVKRSRDDRDRPDAMHIDQPERDRDREVRERERERERERDRDLQMRDRETRDREVAAAARGGGGVSTSTSSKKSKTAAGGTVAEREQPPPPRPASTHQGLPPTPSTKGGSFQAPSRPPSTHDRNLPLRDLPAHMLPPPSATPAVHGPPPPPGFRDRDHYPPEDVKPERDRDRVDRDRTDRDRQREREQRDREQREREQRERERDRSAAPAVTTSAGAALPPSSTAPAPVPVAPTPTPTEQPLPAAPTSPSTAVPAAPTTTAPAAVNGAVSNGASAPTSASQLTMSALIDMDPDQVPAELKKEGGDWFAIFNPQAQRKLDISLTLSLAHESVVCCVRFSADGKFLATGCNRTAQIYDTKTGAKTCTLNDDAVTKSGDLYIRSVCFSPDGKLLATGAEDKQIRIWDIATRTIRKVFTGHLQEIYSLDFSRDGSLIVSGSGDKTARVWNMDTGAHQTLSILEPESVDAGVTSVAISTDGKNVAAGSLDTIVRIWDVSSGNLIERLRGHLDSVYSVAFTPDGKGLISGSLDKTLKYWDLQPLLRNPNRTVGLAQGGTVPSGQQPVTNEGGEKGSTCGVAFSGHKDYVLSVAVSPDGAWVVSGSKDRGVQFWDPKTGLTQLMLQGHKNSVISIDLSPVASAAGGLLASGSGDWMARVWSYTPAP